MDLKHKELRLILLIIIVIAITGLKGYAQDRYDFNGNWKINYEKSVALFDESQRTYYDHLPLDSKQHFQQGLSNRTLKFSGADKLEILLTREGQEILINGTWAIEKSTRSLVLQLPSGATRYTIEEANNNALILKVVNLEDERGKAVFSQLYLEKQND